MRSNKKVASNRAVELNGNPFHYRKNTRDSLYDFIEFHKNIEEKLKMSHADTDSYIDWRGMKRPVYDRYDYYVDLLRFILVGDESLIQPDDLDADEAERIVLGFLPESMRLSAMLTGF